MPRLEDHHSSFQGQVPLLDFETWRLRQEMILSELMVQQKYITELWKDRDELYHHQPDIPTEREDLDLALPTTADQSRQCGYDGQACGSENSPPDSPTVGRTTSQAISGEQAVVAEQRGEAHDSECEDEHRADAQSGAGVGDLQIGAQHSIVSQAVSVDEFEDHHWKSSLSRNQKRAKAMIFENYEALANILVAGNSVCIAWQVQYNAVNGHAPGGASTVNLLFCVAFVLDLTCRAYLQRRAFVFSEEWRWNLFDTLVVTCMVLEEVLRRALGGVHALQPLGDVRMLLLARLFRARILLSVRLVRTVSSLLRDGRLLLLSLERAFGLFLWTVVISFAMAYAVGLIMAHGASDRCAGDITAFLFPLREVWLFVEILLHDHSGDVWRLTLGHPRRCACRCGSSLCQFFCGIPDFCCCRLAEHHLWHLRSLCEACGGAGARDLSPRPVEEQ